MQNAARKSVDFVARVFKLGKIFRRNVTFRNDKAALAVGRAHKIFQKIFIKTQPPENIICAVTQNALETRARYDKICAALKRGVLVANDERRIEIEFALDDKIIFGGRNLLGGGQNFFLGIFIGQPRGNVLFVAEVVKVCGKIFGGNQPETF